MSDAGEIVMPRLSDTMEEGTILRWLLDDGARVARGQELVEIETDKASMTYDADVEGTLQIVVPEGETVAVGTPIARVGPPGEAGASAPSKRAAVAAVPSLSAAGAAAPPQAGESPRSRNGDAAAHAVPATPLARRAARLHDVALERVSGTAPRGRIVRADVLDAAGAAPAPRRGRAGSEAGPAAERGPGSTVAPAPAPASGVASIKGATRRVEATRTQQLVARRMAEAKATVPEFQVQTDVAMDAAIALRAELRAILEEGAPSLNDLIVKASAIALRWNPRANGSYVDGGFDEHERVNVGVAVAGEETLVVPVVHDADCKALAQIARETRRLAERVRSGAVTPPELAGATFTVSNLGMYGMTQIVPVINPPQAAILGVGAIRETLVLLDGEIVERRLLALTLSCDHRILYGADASLFLSDVKSLLEAPLRLAL